MNTKIQKSILLIGCMGAGKSFIGRGLADDLLAAYADVDSFIEEQSDMNISDIFTDYGEGYFRDLEHIAFRKLIESDNRQVIAAGGGLPLSERNRLLMKTRAECLLCVYLSADIDTLWERVRFNDNRPLLKKSDPRAELERLLKTREPIYRQCADITVITDHKDRQAIIQEIRCFIS